MAQVHPAQARIPSSSSSSKRHPFTNAVNHNQRTPLPPKGAGDKENLKEAPAPPLPRQNAKAPPPSPPRIICDNSGAFQLHRVGLLGEGGFARVYEVKQTNGSRLACKVVTKSSLASKKAKTKLYAEIKIHSALEHPNIVRFRDCFEDDDNVYMTLELCPCGSLMDMLRRRRRFSEPEARFFMIQLMGACRYMHEHQVIHRDLKLGNIFLDSNMNIKVGDFGLAALIENPGERKKTICGTPNYIAPEVLFDTANGHSFEVDTWSIGVILYTLIIGRPPFQTSDVKAIYKRIRDNAYDFPPERAISFNAQNLIQRILTHDPQQRPTLHEIADHLFFTEGTFPSYIPASAHDAPPDFKNITRSQSQTNLRRIRRYSLFDEDQVTTIALPKVPIPLLDSPADGKTLMFTVAQQEKEFQKAVQPGSPISALLSSAKQPLLVGGNGTQGGMKENPLLRKLQAAKESPLRKSVVRAQLVDERAGAENGVDPDRMREDHAGEGVRTRRKELEAQKARIVAQMAPVREEDEDEHLGRAKEADKRKVDKERVKVNDRENLPPAAAVSKGKERDARPSKTQPFLPASSTRSLVPTSQFSQLSGYDAASHVLSLAFEAKAAGKVFRDPRDDPTVPLPEERVFIVSWVDYCNKYGMGYALTDGSVGVHFNDSTSLVLSPDKHHFDYITSRRQGTAYVRKSHAVDAYPEDLKNKVYLLKHFERYIMDRLYGQYDYTFEDTDRTRGMEWMQKYLRMKQVIVFKLSHNVLQFNFFDHSKLILSSHGLMVTYIDKEYRMMRWTLQDIMTLAIRPSPDVKADVLKFNQRLVDKLHYCLEVLISIRKASEGGLAPSEEDDQAVARKMPSQPLGVSTTRAINQKASKTSLR